MAAGAPVLTATAILATKPNKKLFSLVQTAFAGRISNLYRVREAFDVDLLMTTASGNGGALELQISGSSIGNLETKSNQIQVSLSICNN